MQGMEAGGHEHAQGRNVGALIGRYIVSLPLAGFLVNLVIALAGRRSRFGRAADDRIGGDAAARVGEAPGGLHGRHGVAVAVGDEERRRVRPDMGQR
jgi:hypothetical protein